MFLYSVRVLFAIDTSTPAAVGHPQPGKQVTGDVGPKRTEPHVQHIDRAGDHVAFPLRFNNRQLNHTVHRHFGADLGKADNPRSKPRAGVGINIAAVEGVALAPNWEAGSRFRQ